MVPTAQEFGRALNRYWPCWRSALPALKAVVHHLGLNEDDWPLEPVWSCLDWYAKLVGALPLPKPWSNESRDLKKAILRIYGKRCAIASSDVRRDGTLGRLLTEEMKPGDVLASLNYDTVAESVASRFGIQLDARPRGGARIAFVKPHGSVSWTLNLVEHSLIWLSNDGAPLTTPLSEDAIDIGQEPLVLGTVPIKSELIVEVQSAYAFQSVYQAVLYQWRVLVEAVRDADLITLVGYRLPPEDLYRRFLLQEGLRLRSRDMPVHFYELDASASATEDEIKSTFGDRLEQAIHRGPVVEASS